MDVEHSGGQMAAGIKDNLEMESKVDMGFYIARLDMFSMRVHGITACSMEKVHSFSKMVRNTKDHSSRTNSMGMAYSTKKIQQFMGFGKIINYQ